MIKPHAIPHAYKRVEQISTRHETLGASLYFWGRHPVLSLSPSRSGRSVRLILSLFWRARTLRLQEPSFPSPRGLYFPARTTTDFVDWPLADAKTRTSDKQNS